MTEDGNRAQVGKMKIEARTLPAHVSSQKLHEVSQLILAHHSSFMFGLLHRCFLATTVKIPQCVL